MATHATHTPRPKGRHAGPPRRRIRIDEHLPVDHRLSRVYRFGAGLMGLFLLVFGVLGLIDKVGWFDTRGDEVVGLSTNGTLSVLSIAVGLLLLVGMVIGGNFASTLNMTLGVLFVLSGFANLALLDTDSNFLAFRIQNVLFSFVVGVLLMTFGMYGRVGTALPHDSPYWRARHPEESEREMRRKAAVGMAKLERADALPGSGPGSSSGSGSDGKGAG
ncbi:MULTISPECIES: DUF4383 domain-containing protein [Streptomyces]|jgi:hypothetical protein|uniref:DUF4383 domain-containing protein n=1 Tax=Streptomyces bottropensis ATCC 25435 TaxID=1054862 RepID=M3DGE5_9ACTN|nr:MULTISPECIES: DUF4383 domain-containing protein [Streptomyces]EMF55747.1 hypothetical protein SBD_3060 [Streptomyces bottropensis ATCC 25435]MZD16303.1 DUF4383 domain-containing protein [Streptomyces sp. SID5476]